MGLDCGARCLKILMVTFNIIFWLCGVAILALGIWIALDEDAFETLNIMNPEGMDYIVWKAAIYTMIGVGAFVFLVGFLGWVGACMENGCLLMCYAVLAGIALVGEIVCATLALVFEDSINQELEYQMFEDLTTKYTTVEDTENSYVSTWNNFQTKFECCGSYNYTDWTKNPNYGSPTESPVPWTCCKMSEKSYPPEFDDVINPTACYAEARSANPSYENLNSMGCHEALQIWVQENSVIIYGTLFGLMALQIVGIVFACIFRCQVD